MSDKVDQSMFAEAYVNGATDHLRRIYNLMVLMELQNVVRNWYARDPAIVITEDDLVRIAYECEEAFKQCKLTVKKFLALFL